MNPIDVSFRMKYWEIIADNLSKAGWSWGYVSAIDSEGRTIWVADAHRGDGKRFVVRSDEKLSAFVELERSPKESGSDSLSQCTPSRRRRCATTIETPAGTFRRMLSVVPDHDVPSITAAPVANSAGRRTELRCPERRGL